MPSVYHLVRSVVKMVMAKMILSRERSMLRARKGWRMEANALGGWVVVVA
jgi:hypothetical protein